MSEASVEETEDSELAAFLDEGLFGNNPDVNETVNKAVGGNEQLQMADVVRQQAQQQEHPLESDHANQRAKRPRLEPAANIASVPAEQICPPHPGFCFGMCIRCGASKPDPDMVVTASATANGNQSGSEPAMTRIKHLHHRQGALEVSADEAARIATEGVKKLLTSKRLVLVLDLDHTLLNTVRDCDLQGSEREAAFKYLEQQQQAIQQQQNQQQQIQNDKPSNAPDEVQVSEPLQDPATNSSDQQLQQHLQHQRIGSRPHLYNLADRGLWTKLRPGVEKFLSAVAPLYELHIYTMGDKGYAGLMADLLDPEHKLFVGRVVSAADSTRAGVKDLDVLLADESLVLILDDTEHVWENHKANLIQVERYHFFGASARLFHPGAQSPLEAGADEPEQGGMLDKAAQLLTRLHERVYGPATSQQQEQQQQQQEQQPAQRISAFDQAAEVLEDGQQQVQQQQQQQGRRAVRRPIAPTKQQQESSSNGSRPGTPAAAAATSVLVTDVRECLEAELGSILAGCCIVFSRCWPNSGHDPADHPLWQLVLRMGGRCSMKFTPGGTTHLVVAPDKNDPGQIPLTDKVRVAQEAGVPIVHPDWLLACKYSWARQPEEQYLLPHYTGGAVAGPSSSRLLGPPPRAAAVEQEKQAVMRGAGKTT